MFETAELGRTVSKKDFEEQERLLRTELLQAQRDLIEAKIPVIVIVSGVEGAGKGSLVNRLCSWLDTRAMEVHVFWDSTDEERERPRWWRFWRTLPPRGRIGVLFGSWYTHPIVEHSFERMDAREFEHAMYRVKDFEHTLTLDGALFVKFWAHLSKEAQHQRWVADEASGRTWEISPLAEEYGARYDAFLATSEKAIRLTDTGTSPWYLVESADPRYRDLTVGRTLLAAIRARLQPASEPSAAAMPGVVEPDTTATVLDRIDLTATRSKSSYRAHLDHWQRELNRLSWAAYHQRRSTVAVFEGWDAAGKGGAIRRVIASVDARLSRVITIAAPSDEERAQHYLWRFWRHVPRDGRLTIYDRSWYGRVLVERIEGFARQDEWMRAYNEINTFEEQLIEHGTILAKFWVHISPEEQLRRFEERQKIPWKKHKITEEDWRNRDKWPDYSVAVNDMVQHTSSTSAPWTLVPGNDKRYARVKILETLCRSLATALDEELSPPD